jgi:hypothetical protein
MDSKCKRRAPAGAPLTTTLRNLASRTLRALHCKAPRYVGPIYTRDSVTVEGATIEGISFTRLYRPGYDRWELEVGGHRVPLTTTQLLLRYLTAQKVVDMTGIVVPKMSRREWDRLLQKLMDERLRREGRR